MAWIIRLLNLCPQCWYRETVLKQLHYAFLRVDPTGGNKKMMRCMRCKHQEWR